MTRWPGSANNSIAEIALSRNHSFELVHRTQYAQMEPHPFDLTGTFQSALQGDNRATVLLVEYYRKRLIEDLETTIHPRLASRFNLADVLQELCLQLLNSAKSGCKHKRAYRLVAGSSKGAYKWIRKLTIRRMIDQYRKHIGTQMRDARREHLPCDSDYSGPENLRRFDRPCVLVHEPPSKSMHDYERSVVIKNAIDKLRPKYREVILLKVFHGYSTAEISEHLGVSQATVSKRYIRGLMIMKECPSVQRLI